MLATIVFVVIEPRTLRQVDFRFRSRGYNPDDVDDFLERLAMGLEALHRQIEETGTGGVRAAAPAVDPAVAEDPPEPGVGGAPLRAPARGRGWGGGPPRRGRQVA